MSILISSVTSMCFIFSDIFYVRKSFVELQMHWLTTLQNATKLWTNEGFKGRYLYIFVLFMLLVFLNV